MKPIFKSTLCATPLLAGALLLSKAPVRAWWPQGHSLITMAAVRALPPEVPAFFRDGEGLAAHCAQDPDVSKNRDVPLVTDREAPEHFFDFEMLQGEPLPRLRSEYLKLCARLDLDPKEVGTAPFAIAEWTERLAVAFAEHRRYPDNPHIKTKCLVYAGFLAHYAEDLCMPLHTTIHHDGRVRANGKSPRSGIHPRVDSLPEKLNLQPDALAKDLKIEALEELLPGVVAQMENSRALIDRTYELEAQLPPGDRDLRRDPSLAASWKPSPAITAFATERARESARFTAALYLTAWRKSAQIKLPVWLDRDLETKQSAKAPPSKTKTPSAKASTAKLTLKK